MRRRASLGKLTMVRGRKIRLPLVRPEAATRMAVILMALLVVVVAGRPASTEARSANPPVPARFAIGTAELPSHYAMLPLIMRNVPATDGCTGTSSCNVVVHVTDIHGNPIEGARIVGLYTDSEGQTTSLSRVTDANGQAIFPGFVGQAIFEVQFPVGLLPCPGSPPRIQANSGESVVKFVGCWL